MVEKVLKVATEKEVGGWLKAGRRGVPGSVPSTIEARDRSGALLGTTEGTAYTIHFN